MNSAILIALGCILTSTVVSSAFVDPGVVFSEWEGWGTSLAWFGDILGGMKLDVQNEISSALFSVIFTIDLRRN